MGDPEPPGGTGSATVVLEYDVLSPDTLAAAMVAELGRSVEYRSVESDGADRAAGLIAELL